MPLQTLLPFSLFRPFKNIRSILGEGGGEKVSFPSPRPAALAPRESERKKKIEENPNPQNTLRPQKPKRGRRSGDAPGRLGSPAGSPTGEGGREGGQEDGRRCPGAPRAPAGSPGGAERAPRNFSASPAGSPGCRSPRAAPPAPWPGERSWSRAGIPRAAGARRWAKRLGSTLPKTPKGGAVPLRADLPGCFLASLPPRRISPGRALREGGFLPPEAPLPTRAPRSPARPPPPPRDGAGQGGGPARLHSRWAKPPAALPPPG